ncbi:MAG: exodeoxyribonuclease VII small subunit [Planctomycetes bacterium]|nr:exodeoxyribonuclease VII small subunit [Planctomycetota bacterium]
MSRRGSGSAPASGRGRSGASWSGRGRPAVADERSFEEEMAALEAIVADLERGELGLEEAIRRYEEGIGIVRRCLGILETAEGRIEVLAREGGEPVFRPFAGEEGGE